MENLFPFHVTGMGWQLRYVAICGLLNAALLALYVAAAAVAWRVVA